MNRNIRFLAVGILILAAAGLGLSTHRSRPENGAAAGTEAMESAAELTGTETAESAAEAAGAETVQSAAAEAGTDAGTPSAAQASALPDESEELEWYELPDETGGENDGQATDGDAADGEDSAEETSEEDILEAPLEEKVSLTFLQTSIRDSLRNKKYILADSSKQYLEWKDVKGLNQDEINMARCEIYARHGYRFEKKAVKRYFEAKKWYKASVDPSDFKASKVLNDVEKYNYKYLESLETESGKKGLSTAATKKKVDSYGYENGYSKLSFKLKKGSLVKKKGYYEVTAVFRKAITVPGDLKKGESVKVSFDDLKGSVRTLVRGSDGLYDKDHPEREYEYHTRKGKVTLYEDSGDRVDKPVYQGKLFIREDAVEGRWMGKTKSFRAGALKKHNLEYNAVTFDQKGYAVRLMTIGD